MDGDGDVIKMIGKDFSKFVFLIFSILMDNANRGPAGMMKRN